MVKVHSKTQRTFLSFPGGSSVGRARGRGTAALAGFVVGGILLAGCSGSSNSGADPVLSDTASPSVSDSATPTPTMTVYGSVEEQKRALPKSRDGLQTGAVMNRAVATTPEEEAVANAWLRYWQVRTKAFMDAKLDPAARDAVATGEAAEAITKPTQERKAKHSYTRGVLILNPTKISISGNTAILLECMLDDSQDIYADGSGEPAEILPTGIRAHLKKSQNEWRTDKLSYDEKFCTNKGVEQG